MKKREIDDEWLREMMPKVSEQMLRDLEEQARQEQKEAGEFQFSERFEKNMEKLFRKVEWHEKLRGSSSLRTVAAACLALCVCLVGGGLLYASGRIFYSVKKTPDTLDMTKYTYHVTEDVQQELEIKKPGYIPEGYELVDEQEDVFGIVYIYQNASGEYLTCEQHIVHDGDISAFNNEYDWEDEIGTAYGTVSVQGYDSGYAFGYLEYMNFVFMVDTVNLDNTEMERIYTEWLAP